MKILSANLTVVVLIVVSFASSVAAQTPIGYVLEIKGDWHLTGHSGRVLSRWQKVPAGAQISLKTPASDAYIVIASLGGEIIDKRKCEDEDCSRPIKLPQSNITRSPLRVAVQAITELLYASPLRYSLHRNRNLGALVDGVVRLDKGEIDFSPVLTQTGSYYLRWRPRPHSSSAAGKWAKPVALRTERGKPVLVMVPNVKPGVYEINLQRRIGNSYETFASAWVLVSPAAKYESATAAFQQAVDLTEQWGSLVEPDTAQQFLRAQLDYLAGQPTKQK